MKKREAGGKEGDKTQRSSLMGQEVSEKTNN